MSFADRCEREVRGLHEFFEAWFTGRIPDSEAEFARVAGALGPDFEMVTPDGERRDRESVLGGIRQAHGNNDDFSIRIRDLEPLDATEDRCLVAYEEHQDGATETGRASTALFAPDDDAPEGVRWIHLQETWLPGRGPED